MLVQTAYSEANRIGEAIGIHSSAWAIYDGRFGIQTGDDFNREVYPDGITIIYDGDWSGLMGESVLPGPVTLKDMWVAADLLIHECGDGHHVFIEDFVEVSPGVVSLETGS